MPSFENVWNKYYSDKDIVTCPLCRKNKMKRDIHSREYQKGAWQRGHIEPKCNGGKSTLENIRAICWTCNKKSGDMDMRDYAEKKGYNYDKSIIPPKPTPKDPCCSIL